MTISLFILFAPVSNGQLTGLPAQGRFADAKIFQTDSGTVLIQQLRKGCKNFDENSFVFHQTVIALLPLTVPKEKIPDFIIHGNLTYNFNYRSYLDTPFAETNLMQHTLQTRLNIKYKDKYPFTVYLTGRTSNSPFFSNEFDVSVQFRQADMLEDIKRKMRSDADGILYNKAISLTPAQLYELGKNGMTDSAQLLSTVADAGEKYSKEKAANLSAEFKKRYEKYKDAFDKLSALSNSLHHSAEQEAVEAKEKKIRNSVKKEASAKAEELFSKKTEKYRGKADSIKTELTDEIAKANNTYDSLKNKLATAEKGLKEFQKKIRDSVMQIKKQVAAITDKNRLYDYFRKKGETVQGITRLQKALLSVKQIGIGRTWIDYSELTVKNISITGLNIEANPGNIYFAAAAGKVNYRFRDYIVKGTYNGSGQSVALLRAGFGNKDRNNFILTWYSGNKALVNQTPIGNTVRKISGFSIESRTAINANNYIIGEYARSVSPGIPGKILSLNTHNNEAWNIKLFSTYKKTRFTGYFRRMGEGFQSFILYPTNNRQDAWQAKLAQSFWKKRITAEAGIRKNDFNSPIALPDFSNKNVFKSFQLIARIPKYPFLMIGYYPSSQLVLSDNKTLYENRYNTLNAVMSHSYLIRKISMNSNLCYTKFYNSGSDTGFIYYNAETFTFNHSVQLKHFVLEGGGVLTEQTQLHQLTIEPGLTWKPNNHFSLSGSAKWSRVNHTETLWGGSAGMNWWLKKLGVIQFHWEKIWLPGYNRNLLPVDIGRITYSREF